mmetsp:Transcript_12347/g.21862  ORF Transcript_12347/g.21862 Transcript_12347/m.21862 type:complete len:278 (-) Transcript_12347:170-1003(-)
MRRPAAAEAWFFRESVKFENPVLLLMVDIVSVIFFWLGLTILSTMMTITPATAANSKKPMHLSVSNPRVMSEITLLAFFTLNSMSFKSSTILLSWCVWSCKPTAADVPTCRVSSTRRSALPSVASVSARSLRPRCMSCCVVIWSWAISSACGIAPVNNSSFVASSPISFFLLMYVFNSSAIVFFRSASRGAGMPSVLASRSKSLSSALDSLSLVEMSLRTPCSLSGLWVFSAFFNNFSVAFSRTASFSSCSIGGHSAIAACLETGLALVRRCKDWPH